MPTPSATILVIEDEIPLLENLALGLEDHGFQTLCAGDAAEGLRLAHAHRPDLILCDIEIPGSDGWLLLQTLRDDPVLSDRPFILMSGQPAFRNERLAMDLGADDFLRKPFSLEDLLRCVRARLHRATLSRRLDDRALEEMRASLHSTLPHRFFTPLATILGLSEFLQLDWERMSGDEIRHDLRAIHEAGHRLHRTLRNYLALAEMVNHPFGLPQLFLVADAVAETIAEAAAGAAARLERRDDLRVACQAEDLRLRREDLGLIVEELVDNALRYSRRGNPVRVSAGPMAGGWELSVSDAGPGMSPQQLQRLPPVVPGAGGDGGYGLSVVNRLTRHLEGEFLLTSADDRGTTAQVRWPLAITRRAPPPA